MEDIYEQLRQINLKLDSILYKRKALPRIKPTNPIEEEKRAERVLNTLKESMQRWVLEESTTTEIRTALFPDLTPRQYAQALRAIGINPRHSKRTDDGSIAKCHKVLPTSPLYDTEWYTEGDITNSEVYKELESKRELFIKDTNTWDI